MGIIFKTVVFFYFDAKLCLIGELTCTPAGKTQVRCHFHPEYGPQWWQNRSDGLTQLQ
jgi:hypothetical protein